METVWCDPFSPMRKLSLDGALDGACWSLQSNLRRGGSAASWPVFLSGTGLSGEAFPNLKSFEYNLYYFCHVQTHFTLNQLIFFFLHKFISQENNLEATVNIDNRGRQKMASQGCLHSDSRIL